MDAPTLIAGQRFVDDRGILLACNDFSPQAAGIQRTYLIQNHRARFVRAWHAHRREAKYIQVIQGAAIVCTVPVGWEGSPQNAFCVYAKGDAQRYVLEAAKPQLLYVPPSHANGFKNLTADTMLLFYSTLPLAESEKDIDKLPWGYFVPEIWTINQR